MSIHPIDYRYTVPELDYFLGNKALLEYMLKVEAAYVRALADVGLCRQGVADEVSSKANTTIVTYEKWLERDKNISHDTRAMVELLQEAVSDEAKPYVHLGLTSNNSFDTSLNLMLRDATYRVISPKMIAFERTLIELSRRYKYTVQIGRTHGQHAIPTTFGRELAVYVSRFGRRVERVAKVARNLKGNMGGAIGTKASFKLFYENPDKLEQLTLKKLQLKPVEISTQIIPKELEAEFYSEIVEAHAVVSDLANNVRQLARTEISEVAESFGAEQVGSSTMPQKKNPEGFENICGQYRTVKNNFISVLDNIESEHQRDMRDSAPRRHYVVNILYPFTYSIERVNSLMRSLVVNEDRMLQNLRITGETILSEPAYICLTLQGFPDAHDYVRRITAVKGERQLTSDSAVKDMLQKLPKEKRRIFEDAKNYIGDATNQVDRVTNNWEVRMKELEAKLDEKIL